MIRATAAGVLLLAAVPALAFPDGAPPAHTGGFGEETCGACHFGGEAGAGAGLVLLGAGDRWTPGRAYLLELRLTDREKAIGGFQASIRFADGPDRGRPAGRIETDGDDQQIVPEGGVDYLMHRDPGRADEDGVIRWLVRWTAPSEGQARIAVHAAAVAGNDDESPIGDTVYTLERMLEPE